MIRAAFNIDPWQLDSWEEFAILSNDADWWVRNCLHPQGEDGGDTSPKKGDSKIRTM
tara:strand:- start:591 stop:761 length:171 start_codon:yes stop_codon:yes gene_type:complete